MSLHLCKRTVSFAETLGDVGGVDSYSFGRQTIVTSTFKKRNDIAFIEAPLMRSGLLEFRPMHIPDMPQDGESQIVEAGECLASDGGGGRGLISSRLRIVTFSSLIPGGFHIPLRCQGTWECLSQEEHDLSGTVLVGGRVLTLDESIWGKWAEFPLKPGTPLHSRVRLEFREWGGGRRSNPPPPTPDPYPLYFF